jgi:hypothetical protein
MYEFINKKNFFEIIKKIRHVILFYAAYPFGFVMLTAAVLYPFFINKMEVESYLSIVVMIFLIGMFFFGNLLGACHKYEKFGKMYLKATEKAGEIFVLGGFLAYVFFIISTFILRETRTAEILDYFNTGLSYWISVVILFSLGYLLYLAIMLLIFLFMLNINKWLGYVALFILWLSIDPFHTFISWLIFWIVQYKIVYKYIMGISGLYIFLNFFQIKYGKNMVKKLRHQHTIGE